MGNVLGFSTGAFRERALEVKDGLLRVASADTASTQQGFDVFIRHMLPSVFERPTQGTSDGQMCNLQPIIYS
eukprot:5150914-Amphidinium_carterae.1